MPNNNEECPWSRAMGKKGMKQAKDEATLKITHAQMSQFTSNSNKEGVLNDEDECEEIPETPKSESVQQQDCGCPWTRRETSFQEVLEFNEGYLALKHIPPLNPSMTILELEQSDHVPVHKSWGICMLGIFAGKFPGKQAVYDLMQRWPHKAKVSFHQRGWMVFQFANKEKRELTRQQGPHAIFGIPLIFQPMASDFNPNKDPDINIPVWCRLVDLRATLRSESAINKIASCIGFPLPMDYHTLHRENIDGPRIQVIVNAATKPREELAIRLHTGEFYNLKIEYENMPKYCTKCRSIGHLDSRCMGPKDTIRQPQRQGMVGAKKKQTGQRNNANNPQHGHANRPTVTKKPAVKAQWKPTGNLAGAELVQDPLPEQTDTIDAFALPNIFHPISGEGGDFPPLEEQNRQSKNPKAQKDQNCPFSSIGRIDE